MRQILNSIGFPNIAALMEGLNGVYGQPSNGLKNNRLQSEKVVFYRQRSKMQVKIKGQQALKYVKSHYFSCSSRHSGRVGSPDPPIRPEACLRMQFLHRQDRVSLFNWLIFLIKRGLHFATKLNSRDIQNVIVFEYPPMNCSPLLAKQSFPRQRRPAFTDWETCGGLCEK